MSSPETLARMETLPAAGKTQSLALPNALHCICQLYGLINSGRVELLLSKLYLAYDQVGDEPSKDANAFTPTLKSRIKVNLIRKWVCLAGGDGGYMVLVFIHDGHNLQGCFLKRRSHSLDDLCALCDILSIGGAGATVWTA